MEEGSRYKLGGITFKGNAHCPNTRVLRAQFANKDGEYFNRHASSAKALSSSAKPMESSATSTSSARPCRVIDEAKKLIYLDIDIDEGKQF